MARVNTVTLWFGEDCGRSDEELLRYLSAIGVSTSDLDCIQHEAALACVHLKLHAASAHKISAENMYVFKRKDGSEYFFVATKNGRKVVKVRVRNLPPELSEDEVTDAFIEFGSVFLITENRYEDGPFKGIKNGDRTVIMAIDNDIPSFIAVKNVEATIVYPGQPKTCRRCGVRGHLQATCRTQPGSAKVSDSDASPPEPAKPCVGDVAASGGPPPGRPADDALRAAGRRDQHQHPVTAAAKGGEHQVGRNGKSREEWKPGSENEHVNGPKKRNSEKTKHLKEDVVKLK